MTQTTASDLLGRLVRFRRAGTRGRTYYVAEINRHGFARLVWWAGTDADGKVIDTHRNGRWSGDPVAELVIVAAGAR